MTGRIQRLLTGMLLFGLIALPAASDTETVEIVVNPGIEQPALAVNAVRAIFGMRLRTWNNGRPIRVLVLPDDHSVHTNFSKQVINIYPHQLRLAWDRLVYSGIGQAPARVVSLQDMRKEIAATPGAIGYLPRSMIDDSVRILPIY